MSHVPLEFSDLFSVPEEILSDEIDEGTAFFDKFFLDCELAAALQQDSAAPGMGHAIVSRLNAARDVRGELLTAHYKKLAADAEIQAAREATLLQKTPLKPFLAEREPSSDDSLAKATGMTASQRHRKTLEQYIRKSIASGETLAGIVEYARRYDPETANLLNEIGKELGA